jgi:hypothetical protein
MIWKVYLDICCLIYLLEDVPIFSEQIRKHMTNNTDTYLMRIGAGSTRGLS